LRWRSNGKKDVNETSGNIYGTLVKNQIHRRAAESAEGKFFTRILERRILINLSIL
jgi:hypothetical protein